MSFEIRQGHVIDRLAELPDNSIDCCVSSPPYWGLRSYGVPDQEWGGWIGQLGLEPTPDMFVKHITEVFEQVRRVLKPEGTLWLNLGDSYATGAAKACSPGGGAQGEQFLDVGPSGYRGAHADSPKHKGRSQVPDAKYPNANIPTFQPNRMPIAGLKPKDLVGIPWRVAFSLQAAGWWLRSDIIWAKPAPMPESVTDRPTRSHEYIFLLSKSEKYFYDHEAIKEPSVSDQGRGNGFKRDSRLTFLDDDGPRGPEIPWQPKSWNGSKFDGQLDLEIHPNVGRKPRTAKVHGNLPGRDDRGSACNGPGQELRNKRDVWTVNSDPFPEAHFATFPPALILPCVMAGCPAGGTVLDPFSGAGTTLLVAKENGRNGIGIELNPDYIEMAQRRLAQEVLFA